ncbi:type 2 isopentenyl-diphosphate Delta-isomerase [Hoeflea poritis]|uniref:Isopentenyl-diphosphate delta-isomerase n=1 Tax=Hoeflea poritis TaxID=2993659 RepID=A0ABT4VRN7_9HYPH|nr:type 2 isopentenyl-diphosphate Delta-isomerase [Hoeflea poritis]MDA4846683.1 type 2 isopentenyl-diphosphate Delta-isomerase [Hoeflea poritis]
MPTKRKDEHLSIVLGQRQKKSTGTSGFERIEFVHCALPELNLDQIDLGTSFLGKRISAPILVSSMTGGPERAATINENIARACETLKLPFAVGSQRVAIEEGMDGGLDSGLRSLAPSVPILGNLGAAQFNRGFGPEEALRAVEMIEADALYIHLNPLQEAVQPEGDRDWSGLFDKIVSVSEALPVPVAIKEVGSGISAAVARRFVDAGIAIIDVAGSGGTNWAAVEAARMSDAREAALANAFSDWGIPTVDAVVEARAACPKATIIASGGIKTGIDVAKAVRAGADMAGQAAGLLHAANDSPDSLIGHFEDAIRQLRIVCFCTGSADLAALRIAPVRDA